MYIVFIVAVLIISFIFKKTTEQKFSIQHNYHASLTNKYTLFLCLSLLVKLLMGYLIFSFSTSTLAI